MATLFDEIARARKIAILHGMCPNEAEVQVREEWEKRRCSGEILDWIKPSLPVTCSDCTHRAMVTLSPDGVAFCQVEGEETPDAHSCEQFERRETWTQR
jgi:hypothetical protein